MSDTIENEVVNIAAPDASSLQQEIKLTREQEIEKEVFRQFEEQHVAEPKAEEKAEEEVSPDEVEEDKPIDEDESPEVPKVDENKDTEEKKKLSGAQRAKIIKEKQAQLIEKQAREIEERDKVIEEYKRNNGIIEPSVDLNRQYGEDDQAYAKRVISIAKADAERQLQIEKATIEARLAQDAVKSSLPDYDKIILRANSLDCSDPLANHLNSLPAKELAEMKYLFCKHVDKFFEANVLQGAALLEKMAELEVDKDVYLKPLSKSSLASGAKKITSAPKIPTDLRYVPPKAESSNIDDLVEQEKQAYRKRLLER